MGTSSNAEHKAVCCEPCECSASSSQPKLSRQIAWLQYVTIGWMLVECAASLIAAAQAHSVALLAFGSDSLIELLSASVVLLQFLPRFPLNKSHPVRTAAMLLFLLAGVVEVIAFLASRSPMETTCLAIRLPPTPLVPIPDLASL